ncbi:MAG: hypothetical protein ACRYFZ_01595 [Janthinobacterium lividum]
MNKYFALLLYSIAALVLSWVVVNSGHIEYEFFVKIDFLFAFLGVLIGFALTLFTHVVGLIERLKTEFEKITDEPIKNNKMNSLDAIYDEMRDDITFLFVALAVVVLISILSGFAKSGIVFFNPCISPTRLAKIAEIKPSILLAIFGLSMLSIKDLIQISFKLSRFVIFKKDKVKS